MARVNLAHLWREHWGRILAVAVGLAVLGALPLVPDAQGEKTVHTFTALVPPVVAIVLALATRRLLPSLGTAVVVGAFLHHGIADAVPLGLRDYAWKNATSAWHLYIIGFTAALLGMVQVIARSGGTHGIVDSVKGWISSGRSSRIGTAVMGLFVFFDDYANCMLVGPTMRPLTDKFRVSREKLAYLVDSTAAPVAGLVLLSTWVGHEVGVLDEQAVKLGLDERGYALLFQALPFRFYCVFSLAFVFLTSALGRDFGPMLRAERRAAIEGKLVADGARPLSGGDDEHAAPPEGAPRRAWNAAAPILLVVLVALGGFVYDGGGWAKLSTNPALVASFTFWRETLGASENNVLVLFVAAGAGAVLALTLPLVQGILSVGQAFSAFFSGIRTSAYAIGVLLLAWALATVCTDLGTGPVVVGLLGGWVSPAIIPVATFLVAAVVAFATGTSWGTMSILLPAAVPLAHATGSPEVLVLTMASVLDGAIFGDHCSPISDTTLMSSIASGSDHLDHVRTQFPYALTAMLVALFGGYLLVALGAPLVVSYVGGLGALVGVLFLIGRKPMALQS